MKIAVDFDGTCVYHEFPLVGGDVPDAVRVLKKIVSNGDKIILWTMRSGKPLDDAVMWFTDRGIPLFGVNSNPSQKSWTDSPKAYAHQYIDDAAVGCPLSHDSSVTARPFVNWNEVERILSPVLFSARVARAVLTPLDIDCPHGESRGE